MRPYDRATELPPPPRRECSVCGSKFFPRYSFVYTCSIPCRDARLEALRTTIASLPTGEADLILADPPWHFDTRSAKGQGKSPSRHYATLDIDMLRRLPIGKLAAPDAGLALWVYGPKLPDALSVMRAWGFDYNSDLFTWLKLTSAGQPAFGTGYTTRKNCEQLIYGIKGDGLKAVDHSVRQSILAPKREHSRKPDESYTALERLFGPVRRLELFARQHRAGWVGWGNELPAPAQPTLVGIGP
jgi:N6-adenosine-specific RNA methylase IME4